MQAFFSIIFHKIAFARFMGLARRLMPANLPIGKLTASREMIKRWGGFPRSAFPETPPSFDRSQFPQPHERSKGQRNTQ